MHGKSGETVNRGTINTSGLHSGDRKQTRYIGENGKSGDGKLWYDCTKGCDDANEEFPRQMRIGGRCHNNYASVK